MNDGNGAAGMSSQNTSANLNEIRTSGKHVTSLYGHCSAACNSHVGTQLILNNSDLDKSYWASFDQIFPSLSTIEQNDVANASANMDELRQGNEISYMSWQDLYKLYTEKDSKANDH